MSQPSHSIGRPGLPAQFSVFELLILILVILLTGIVVPNLLRAAPRPAPEPAFQVTGATGSFPHPAPIQGIPEGRR